MPGPIDISGEKFGRLTASRLFGSNQHKQRIWVCSCECGNTTNVLQASLRSGNTKSCGCLQKEAIGERRALDLTGETFGRLTALHYTGDSNDHGRKWLCRCQCGAEVEVLTQNLRDGTVRSCGCLYQERAYDLTGQVFDRLTVIQWTGETRVGGKIWECLCKCGKKTNVTANSLVTNRVKSCGCLYRESRRLVARTHGMSNSREYGIWDGMIQRCCNPNDAAFNYYGARGIQVCDRWRNSFEAFYADMGPSNGLTIDRINNDGNYQPGNCRWANSTVQSFNTRLSTRNKTGIRGVSLDKRSGKYLANMTIKGETVLYDLFDTVEGAEKARIAAEKRYAHLIGKINQSGESYRLIQLMFDEI